MEIEIVTAKKKLSKSYVKQMNEVTLDELEEASVLGYINDLDAQTSRVMLFETDRFEYRIGRWDWKHNADTSKIYRNLKGHWVQEKRFKSPEDAKRYYELLQDFKQQSIQIYI